MKKTKLKIKNIIIAVIILVIIIIAIAIGIKVKKDLDYKKTYEYKLLQIGYSETDTKYLVDKLNDIELNNLLEKDLNENIPKLMKEKYYLKKNLDKYLEYANENVEKTLTEVVAIINVGANNDWYEGVITTDTSKDLLILVNKFNQLSKEYEFKDLVTISNWYAYDNAKYLREGAYEKFIDLYNAAKKDNMTIIINSSYRDYEYQETVYNNNKISQGQAAADSFVARPGHSEHQTGLAIDVTTHGVIDYNFAEFEEYTWMINNAHKYGYILRYPEGKEYLTGYSYESWHYRYVGVEVATYIHENNITYDEYYAYFIAR